VYLARLILSCCFVPFAGCVVTEEAFDPTVGVGGEDDPLLQGAVIIPLDGSGDGGAGGADASLDAYFRSVLDQMQMAWVEGDPETLAALLEAHDHGRTPSNARKRMARYRGLLRSLRFFDWVRTGSGLTLLPPREEDGAAPEDGERVPLGAPARFRLRLGDRPVPDGVADLALWGTEGQHPSQVQLTVEVRDLDGVGDLTRIVRRVMVPLAGDHALSEGPALQPFELNLPAGSTTLRELTVTAVVLPGFVRYGDVAVPHHRIPLFTERFDFYPARIGLVEKQPKRWLDEAMRIGDAQHFRDVLLAVRFLPESDRPAAVRQLMDWVRFGLGDQPKVAMVALEMLTGETGNEGRRDLWLRWFKDWSRARDGGR